MKKELRVKCPHCNVEFEYRSSEWRPFCCERCRMVDLGLWLSESYKVPSNVPLSEEDMMALEQNLEQEQHEQDGHEEKSSED